MPGAGLTVYLAVSTLEYLVVAFFLLGITIFLLLQSRHFKRMESSAGRAFRNQELLDELVALRKAVRPMDFDMGALEDKLDELVQSNVRVEERLLQLSDRISAGREELRSLGLQDIIEQRLYTKGFHSIHVLADVSDMESGEHKINVEVMKGNVPYKGSVTVRDGRVVAERLKPIYEAFP